MEDKTVTEPTSQHIRCRMLTRPVSKMVMALCIIAALISSDFSSAAARTSAHSRPASRSVKGPVVRPSWTRRTLSVRAGSTFHVTLDPTTAKACGVALVGPYEGQQVTWNFKTDGLLLRLTLHTNVDATPGRWSIRATCGQANGQAPLLAKISVSVRGRPQGRALLSEHRDLRVRQVALHPGKDSGRVRARGAGQDPFSSVECVSWAWEKRADIYDRAVAAGVPPSGLRARPTWQYDYVWNAKYWAENAAKAGIPEGPTPVVGAIGVYTQTQAGHVVYVERVNADGSFYYSQRNGTGCECTSAVTYGTDTPRAGLVFIYGGPAGSGPFNPASYVGHIVQYSGDQKAQKTAWLVINDNGGPHRNWIPDAATYNCLKAKGAAGPDVLSADQLNAMPDETGVWAHCSDGSGNGNGNGGNGVDSEAPTSPANLSVSNQTTSSFRLNWSPSADNVGVAGYAGFLNGAEVGTVSVLYADFTGLACGTAYTVAVSAYDAAGNSSDQSSISGSTNPCPATMTFHIEDDFLGGTWARTDPNDGTWYNHADPPPNAAYWYPNGLAVAVDCAVTGAPYVVRFADGHSEDWNTWFHVTDGKWYPAAATQEVLMNSFYGLPSC